MRNCIQIHPLNAKGKYYVNQNACLICEDCFCAAPQNFSYDPNVEYGYYVSKQPETPEEAAQCREALLSCPLEAISDDGETIEWNLRQYT
jgi:ferredoxin